MSALAISALVLSRADGQDSEKRKAPGKEIYQDFRKSQPLLDDFKLAGAPDVGDVCKPEDGGLRITLPAARDRHSPIEAQSNFPLVGDFEITGTYEILSAATPAKGYGVGVSLSVQSNPARTKYAKVARMNRVKAGSVHLIEYWRHDPPKDYKAPSVPTEKKSGQLRLVRKGPSLRYLVSDAPGEEFRELYAQKEFGGEELASMRFVVADSGEAGNPIDARLIDLRVRMGGAVPENATAPAPLPVAGTAAPPPAPAGKPAPTTVAAEGEQARPPRGWLMAGLLIAGMLVLLLMVVLAFGFFLRQRRGAAAAPEDDAPVAKVKRPKK